MVGNAETAGHLTPTATAGGGRDHHGDQVVANLELYQQFEDMGRQDRILLRGAGMYSWGPRPSPRWPGCWRRSMVVSYGKPRA